MAQKPITMEQTKQILQLYQDGIGIREISRRVGLSRNTVRKYLSNLKNIAHEGVSYIDDQCLAEAVYTHDSLLYDTVRLQQLIQHFQYACQELSKTGVTRQLLWREYQTEHPDGYGYSQYCYHFQQYLKNRDLSMHLEYKAGDMLMIDFAGKHLHYTEPTTGELVACEVFVAVLPFSGLIFCYAVHTQQTADFVSCVNALMQFYGGVVISILCDNFKTAVVRSDRYEPVFTEVCLQLSEHYGTTFSATRPYSPRDKAMVERAVNIVYTHVYAPLRNRTFGSLQELNTALSGQLTYLNNKPYKGTPYSRRFLFEQQERAVLRPLPSTAFFLKKVVQLTVQRNYHIQLTEGHTYYSVPYRYTGKKVKVLYDAHTVEVYLGLERIAVHTRSKALYTTLKEHLPPNHAKMKHINGFNQEDLLALAGRIGPATQQIAERILQSNIYMEQGYKSCFGLIMLHKKYGEQRLEAACSRALVASRVNYSMIRNILEKGLDHLNPQPDPPPNILMHDNIRGGQYYQ